MRKSKVEMNGENWDAITIPVYEPFAEYLWANEQEVRFNISLLDVVRFAGHACPSMVGAFFIVKRAVDALYPETQVCERGDIAIDVAAPLGKGPLGPMANVFGYITGAWAETGFGGLNGQFARRGLMRFNSQYAPGEGFRFTTLKNGQSVDLTYDPSRLKIELDPDRPFQYQWRQKVLALVQNPDVAIRCSPLKVLDKTNKA